MNIVTFVRKISNEYDILRIKFDILHTIYQTYMTFYIPYM